VLSDGVLSGREVVSKLGSNRSAGDFFIPDIEAVQQAGVVSQSLPPAQVGDTKHVRKGDVVERICASASNRARHIRHTVMDDTIHHIGRVIMGCCVRCFKTAALINSGDIYQTNVDDQQYFLFIGALAQQILVPINRVQLRGGELEAQAKLLKGLDAFGGLGITDSRINSYAGDPADVGNWAPYVPNMTVNAGLQYRTPITNYIGLVTRVEYRLLGKQYWDTENFTPRDPVNLVALSLGLESEDGVWSASVRADNLFDTKYNAEYVSGGDTTPSNGPGYSEPAIGRVIRGTLRYNF